MKVAVFGGSGFLGYDFVRFALRQGGVEPVVYTSNAGSLSNVCRHDVDVRLYPASDPQAVVLDEDTDVVVNFAHPFERRGGISGTHQIERFVRFIDNAKRLNPTLCLIYLSSMSVFEPFGSNRRFAEADPLRPPRENRYAQEKVLAETALRNLPDADRWQLHLRPTVVYGPFCRPFTDRLMNAFKQGDVGYRDLSGRVQPIYGEDISRFIYDRLRHFTTGVYNLAGPEEMSWQTFVNTFREIVGVGSLVHIPDGSADGEGRTNALKDDIRRLWHVVRQEPAFNRLAARITRRLPRAFFDRESRLLAEQPKAPARPRSPVRPLNTALLGRSFFAEDRLVCDKKCRRDYPTLKLTRVSDVRPVLDDYNRFRFSDCRFV